jgi:cytochrome c556
MLMTRMERALQDGISPQLANSATFERAAAELLHESQMLAMLGEAIGREGYEFWDDEGFQEHAAALRGAAAELTKAASEKNYEAARSAAGRASQACTICHEGYRG